MQQGVRFALDSRAHPFPLGTDGDASASTSFGTTREYRNVRRRSLCRRTWTTKAIGPAGKNCGGASKAERASMTSPPDGGGSPRVLSTKKREVRFVQAPRGQEVSEGVD